MSSFKEENLTQEPQLIDWPTTHYIYTEKVGPFKQTAQPLWIEFHKAFPEILKQSDVKGTMALYKIEPEMVYRAGAIVGAEPKLLPAGFNYEKFEGGKYWKFVLKGSYAQLPQASGRVFEIAKARKIEFRNGFFIEHYANDPSKTAEDQLLTEILIPTK
jgi:DNA gyrase inhibitor GyrI